MSKGNLILVGLAVCLLAIPSGAEVRLSEDFEGLLYECEVLPSLADPVWDVPMLNPSDESVYASSDGDLLEINVLAAGLVAWDMPGDYGAIYFANGTHNYDFAEPNNIWDPSPADGFTLEISTQVIDSVPGTWGYCVYIGEGESGTGGLTHLQMFKDKINGATRLAGVNTPITLYTGDLSDRQHKIRFVRYPGSVIDPFDDPYMELYVDGVLEFTGGMASDDDGTGIIWGGAWNQDWLYTGSLSGSARYHVKTDYIRADFTGPYTPGIEPDVCGDYGYLKGDFNTDCVVDLKDLDVVVQGWLLCSDPIDPMCLNCNDPANAEYCR